MSAASESPQTLSLLREIADTWAVIVAEMGSGVSWWSHIFGESGVNRSGDEVLVSASDSPSLLHRESTFLRFSFKS